MRRGRDVAAAVSAGVAVAVAVAGVGAGVGVELGGFEGCRGIAVGFVVVAGVAEVAGGMRWGLGFELGPGAGAEFEVEVEIEEGVRKRGIPSCWLVAVVVHSLGRMGMMD